MEGKGKIKEVQIEAVIIRADGTREELGLISSSKWKFWSKAKREAEARIKAANSRIKRNGDICS